MNTGNLMMMADLAEQRASMTPPPPTAQHRATLLDLDDDNNLVPAANQAHQPSTAAAHLLSSPPATVSTANNVQTHRHPLAQNQVVQNNQVAPPLPNPVTTELKAVAMAKRSAYTAPKTITNWAGHKWTPEATQVFVDTYLRVIEEHGLFEGGKR